MTCRLYLITPAAFEPGAFLPKLESALESGDVACMQLRLKDVDDKTFLKLGEVVLKTCRKYDVPLLINDRPDLAKSLGADGAHIGQKDMAFHEARKLLGDDAVIGVTCHDSKHFAYEAAENGADYVAFGAFYPTKTKPSPYRPEPEILADWQATMEIPCVAIGGITPANCGPLVEAGADFLAVVSYVWEHPESPAKAVAEFNAAIANHMKKG